MVLISVDLPQPLGPRMGTCSSASMRRLKSSSAIFCPRITRKLRKSSRGGLSAVALIGYVHLSVDEKPRSIIRPRSASITLNPDAAQDLPPTPPVGCDRRAAYAGRSRHVFLRAFQGDECVEAISRQDWVRHQADGHTELPLPA